MEQISLDESYRVDISGTSEGSQDKYYKDGIWYKPDSYGGEGYNEWLSSKLLTFSNLPENAYVLYQEVEINDTLGCSSLDFCGANEQFVSIYRLYANIYGGDIAQRLVKMDMDDGIEYTISFAKDNTGLDLRVYFANTLFLDKIILNTDRHLNNVGVIFNSANGSFREAPIFDNGKSFFCGDKKYDSSASIRENKKHLIFRPFSASSDLMVHYLEKSITIQFDNDKVRKWMLKLPEGVHKSVLRMTF